MNLQSRLLSVAVVAALAAAAPAFAANNQAAGRALGLIDGHAAAAKKADADSFVARDTIIDANGTEHVRFDRTYRGLPVIGGDLVVHSRNGQLKSVSQTLKTSDRPAVNGKISGDEATIVAGADFGSDFEGMQNARKVIYARDIAPRLAYEVVFSGMHGNDPTEMHYFVDANSGKILDKWDMVHTTAAIGTAKTLTLGNVSINTDLTASSGYTLTDTTRGGGSTYNGKNAGYQTAANRAVPYYDADNIWGNNSISDGATVAGDAHYGVAATWDYYKNTHGRNGIFNDGKGVRSYVHVGRKWVNAAWYANAMYYGDGDGATYLPLVALDVAGHEMSHGVTQATANLTYSGESGGLNEANSDIMGTNVEFSVGNASDPGDYVLGEEIYASNPGDLKGLRWLFKPSRDGASPDCYVSTIGSLNVHYSSGVANHFYYLLSQGAVAPAGFSYTPSQLVCNGDTAAGGIGRAKAEKIWYRALSVYMTSSTNYAGARAATVSAAGDLYGVGSVEQNAVKSAWSAVSVN